MECFVPLNDDIDAKDLQGIKDSHQLRQFILFDENLKLFIHWPITKERILVLQSFKIWINDTKILESNDLSYFDKMENPGKEKGNENYFLYQLKQNICKDLIFRSSVVMNNGYNNLIKIQFNYNYRNSTDSKKSKLNNNKNEIEEEEEEDDNDEDEDEDEDENKDEDDEQDYLPSFEPVNLWNDNRHKHNPRTDNGSRQYLFSSTSLSHIPPQTPSDISNPDLNEDFVNFTSSYLNIEFPIYSLLSMRLRNNSIKSLLCIYSSLDFQISKSALQLNEEFLNSEEFKLIFNKLDYQLLDNSNTSTPSHITINPICPLSLPFEVSENDSFSLGYKLPLFTSSSTIPLSQPPLSYSNLNISNLPSNNVTSTSNQLNSQHRIRVTLNYSFVSASLPNTLIPISTCWETDVTLKRNTTSSNRFRTLSQTSSLIYSVPKFGNLPITNSSTSLLQNSSMNNASNNNLNRFLNVKFKFLNNNIKVTKGKRFILRLQIINLSNSALDLVIYYNNNTNNQLTNGISSPINANGSINKPLSLDKQYQFHKKFSNLIEGIILKSNDFKLPLINSNESYFVDLNFIGIISGYYSSLNGLKVLDLQSNEMFEIGNNVSVLVQ
ncbi:hypothetical protein TBLA_0B06580 [Henningerozyma blattae CBS 6284]|uniref:Uncharacterized protein n=1 Tax=Henningerozyma blattae (strain ATCC 34711 / CBS 6284 / DSM 70876 / NBRC 10599 / NRRL Y-10934 / UCD 77-7) TaxID=1071380 RepID=I2GZC9_HENB6|nr:hypothetical protein TBLA_0B06580 [Tetrapisispora blattae CBS 6284]CCH59481.1 hypothetical protein TBLA_0B06580 [Tetrapisispora blattae CBS 6284]